MEGLVSGGRTVGVGGRFVSPVRSLLSVAIFVGCPGEAGEGLLVISGGVVGGGLRLLGIVVCFSVGFGLWSLGPMCCKLCIV